MKNILKLEEAGVFILSIFLMTQLPVQLSWWLYPILFLAPDIGMIGYLINTRIGAFTYNLFHHKLTAVALIVPGILYENEYLILGGLMLLAHSSFDRLLNYGLKYPDSFRHTHLGEIGKQ